MDSVISRGTSFFMLFQNGHILAILPQGHHKFNKFFITQRKLNDSSMASQMKLKWFL